MENLFPKYKGEMQYVCLSCDKLYPGDSLLYICPACGGVFLLEDKKFAELKKISGLEWRDIFDQRASTNIDALRGVFRFYELMAPVLEIDDIIYLGEGNTPIIEASASLKNIFKHDFAIKNDGQNPSASFKDRGMACAFSYLKYMVRKENWKHIITVCASTGDTSAAAAMYAAYVGEPFKSVVLLPKGKVTPQQLAQPLGSGAMVLEIPGVFDDCMKVVEHLSENYRVALLNSKNAWRILGQESYAYEVAQWYSWDLANKAIFVPIGNAGNISAILSGFLKLYALNIIEKLPKIFGVQSSHADPVYQYYNQDRKEFKAVKVRASVAQAAMIGNPVSFSRVKKLVDKYESIAGVNSFNVVQVLEQEIIESMLLANKNGHIICTQGGESLAGMKKAKELGLLKDEFAVIDSTAHNLKFSDFQNMYFEDAYPVEYEIIPDMNKSNKPLLILDEKSKKEFSEMEFTACVSKKIADLLKISAQ